MKPKSSKVLIMCVGIVFMFATLALGNTLPEPITAEQAFDAVVMQIDPISGEHKKVVLVDVRTRAEYYWVGTPCKVQGIQMRNGETIIPDWGKVKLILEGKFLEFATSGAHKRVQVRKVQSLSLTPIARNIPYELWDENTASLETNSEFSDSMEDLLEEGFQVVILFCRSGARSQNCVGNDFPNFEKIYEIDQPDGVSGHGGFEGGTYSNAYNGYRGFPERLTEVQDHPSVSWKDAGLPIKTSVNPLTVPSFP